MLVERLALWSTSQERLLQRAKLLENVVRLAAQASKLMKSADTFKAACPRPNTMCDLTMVVRKFHDEFEQDKKRRCAGMLYVTDGVLNDPDNVHCEHSIPISLLAQALYHKHRFSSQAEIIEFLLANSVLAAMTPEEEKQIASKYKRAHPEIHSTTLADSLRPFLRYAEARPPLRIFCTATGGEVNATSYTLLDHKRLIKMLPLFSTERYA